ncbi:MAG: S26 family signal peptidase [Planctomycetota bacterium]|nr:S26 family signal peptidase [Planctomycetota bacterium]
MIPAPLRIPIAQAIAAVIPGMPHVRSRSMGRRGFGWGIAAAWLVCIIGTILVIGDPLSDFLLYLAIVVHSTSFAMLFSDGLGSTSVSRRVGLGLACFVLVACFLYAPVVYGAGQFVRPVQLTNIRGSANLEEGDVVLCTGPWLNRGEWKVGDLVLVRMDSSSFGNGYVLDSRYNLDRLIGMPGDDVRFSNRVVSVNGEILPDAMGPVGSFRPDLEYVVPPDRYFVAPSALRWTVHGIDAGGVLNPMYIGAGTIRTNGIVGRVIFRIRPWSRIGRLEGANP